MTLPGPTQALIVDIDGVVSPVHGRTAWGDDVVAGQVFGDVLVSPTLCRRLDQLSERPHLTALWLTSWPAEFREQMNPFPGRTWPQITSQPNDPDLGWWKWSALLRWLDNHPTVQRLAWCDDHLTDTHLLQFHAADDDEPAPAEPGVAGQPYGLAVIHAELDRRGTESLLVAPRTDVGITRQQMDRLGLFLASG